MAEGVNKTVSIHISRHLIKSVSANITNRSNICVMEIVVICFCLSTSVDRVLSDPKVYNVSERYCIVLLDMK